MVEEEEASELGWRAVGKADLELAGAKAFLRRVGQIEGRERGSTGGNIRVRRKNAEPADTSRQG